MIVAHHIVFNKVPELCNLQMIHAVKWTFEVLTISFNNVQICLLSSPFMSFSKGQYLETICLVYKDEHVQIYSCEIIL